MSLQGFSQEGPLTYLTASNAIGANLLVTLTATAGVVDLCGASGYPVGIADAPAGGNIPAATEGTFFPLKRRVLVIASAAINPGDFCKAAAAGQVAPEATVTTLTAATIGQAETAASGAGVGFYMVCS